MKILAFSLPLNVFSKHCASPDVPIHTVKGGILGFPQQTPPATAEEKVDSKMPLEHSLISPIDTVERTPFAVSQQTPTATATKGAPFAESKLPLGQPLKDPAEAFPRTETTGTFKTVDSSAPPQRLKPAKQNAQAAQKRKPQPTPLPQNANDTDSDDSAGETPAAASALAFLAENKGPEIKEADLESAFKRLGGLVENSPAGKHKKLYMSDKEGQLQYVCHWAPSHASGQQPWFGLNGQGTLRGFLESFIQKNFPPKNFIAKAARS